MQWTAHITRNLLRRYGFQCVSKCVCSNQTVETWQKPWINSVKAHSLAVPVLQNPSSFLIAQIGPHFIRIPSALDLFHWKAKEQESIPSTLSFNLACANTYSWPTLAHHRITDLAIRRKTWKNRRLSATWENWRNQTTTGHPLMKFISFTLCFRPFRIPSTSSIPGIQLQQLQEDSRQCFMHSLGDETPKRSGPTMWPEESWRRAKGNKRKQTTNIASNEVENTNKLKGWTSEWTGGSQLRTKALQGDQN